MRKAPSGQWKTSEMEGRVGASIEELLDFDKIINFHDLGWGKVESIVQVEEAQKIWNFDFSLDLTLQSTKLEKLINKYDDKLLSIFKI